MLRRELLSVASGDSITIQLAHTYIVLDGTPLTIRAATNVTILGENTTIDAAQLSRIFSVHGHLRLEQVRLTGGSASKGGGLKAAPGSSVVLNGVLIDNCTARTAGGALAVLGASATLNECTISNCSAVGAETPAAGGALYAEDALKHGHLVWSHLIVRSSTITDCSVEGAAPRESEDAVAGGALDFKGASSGNAHRVGPVIENTTISRCSVVANKGRAGGAGVHCINAVVMMRASTIEHCTAISRRGDAYGGAVYVFDGGMTITSTRIAYCAVLCLGSEWYSYAFGGALYLLAAGTHSLSLEDCQILSCSSTVQSSNGQVRAGAALLTHKSRTTVAANSMSVKRCTIAGCTATHHQSGSAIAAAISFLYVTCLLEDVKVRDCTGSGVSVYGGAMYASSADLTFRRCEITSCAAIATGATGTAFGGGLLLYGSANFENSSLFNCSATAIGNAMGGALDLSSSGRATLKRTSITRSSAVSTGNLTGRGEGGGAAVRGGTLRMGDGSFLQHNFASDSGNSLVITGDVTYVFPTAPGTWAAARSCRVYRQACDSQGTPFEDLLSGSTACERTQDQCSLVANRSAVISGTDCRPPLLIQPCDCELERYHSTERIRTAAWPCVMIV